MVVILFNMISCERIYAYTMETRPTLSIATVSGLTIIPGLLLPTIYAIDGDLIALSSYCNHGL